MARDRPRRADALVSAPAFFRGRRVECVRSWRNCWPPQLPVNVLAKATPLHGASHIQVWRNLVQIAREPRAANLPIPNIPLKSLSYFPFVDFKFLEPLLHDELRLPPNEHDSFLDWKECREHRLAEYLTKCPTLLPTAQLLDLDLPKPNPE